MFTAGRSMSPKGVVYSCFGDDSNQVSLSPKRGLEPSTARARRRSGSCLMISWRS